MMFVIRSHLFSNTICFTWRACVTEAVIPWRFEVSNSRAYSCRNERSELAKLIQQHTVVTRRHLTPEMKLNLITPECDLWYSDGRKSPFFDPYWAFYWPGGQALSRFILDNPQFVANKTILDVGCGSGACGIAAALSGALTVTANDINEAACCASSLNADLNYVKLEINNSNLIGGSTPWDCILVGDMFYDEEFSSNLFSWLNFAQTNEKSIIIGDASRMSFTKMYQLGLRLLKTYELPENVRFENDGLSAVQIWSF